METVCQLYQDCTHVKLYRREYLTEVVHLFRLVILRFLLLGNNANQEGNIVTETLTYLVYRIRAIFDYIMQECCHYRICTKFHLLGYNSCHGYRMTDVRLTRLAPLVFMRKLGEFVCRMYQQHLFLIHSLLH